MKSKALFALAFVAAGSIARPSSNAYADTTMASSASPATTVASGPATATFAGHTINLASGWDGAQACLIWRSHGITECFATEAELMSREQQLRPASATPATPTTAPAVTTCSSSLDLYSGSNYTGLHLALWDEGYWQEMADYGFNKATRSFLGGACSFHLAQGNYGQGYWYPGDTGAWSFAPDMGSWDNTVSSVYIN